MKKVAVIGAGAAGLCTGKHLIQQNIVPVIFEQRKSIGGTWVYEEVDKDHQKDVFSSIYEDMRTNLPKQVMAFPDFSFPETEPSFMHYSSVLLYLQKYAEHFKLNSYIQLNTKVMHVTPVLEEYNEMLGERFVKWKIKYQNLCSYMEHTEIFDGIVLCCGQYNVPIHPMIEGFKHFKGYYLHSHYYRHAKDFQNQNVIILGAGPSGHDIMMQLFPLCNTLYLSHKGKKRFSVLPANVKEVSNVSHVNTDGEVVLESGDVVQAQSFIACTGYKFQFPFLSADCRVIVTDKVIKNLFKMCINICYPSMVIVGIPRAITPFPLFHQQAAYVSYIFSEVGKLPSQDDMVKDTEETFLEKQRKGIPEKYSHKLGPEQFLYNDMLADLSGLPKNPKFIEKLYLFVTNLYKSGNLNFKDLEFSIINDNDFEII